MTTETRRQAKRKRAAYHRSITLCAHCHQPRLEHGDGDKCLFEPTTFKIQYGDFPSRWDSSGNPIFTRICRLCGRHDMSHGPRETCLSRVGHWGSPP